MGNILAHMFFLFFLQGIKSESGHVMILNLLDLFGAITMTSLDDVTGRLTAPPVFSIVLGFVYTCSLYRYPQLHCMFADLNLSISCCLINHGWGTLFSDTTMLTVE